MPGEELKALPHQMQGQQARTDAVDPEQHAAQPAEGQGIELGKQEVVGGAGEDIGGNVVDHANHPSVEESQQTEISKINGLTNTGYEDVPAAADP